MTNNEVMLIAAIVVAFMYVQLIMRFTFGWFGLKHADHLDQKGEFILAERDNAIQSSSFVSVVIAARNEATTIFRCLEAVALQHYPSQLFEIIVVNDHSTDDTENEVKQLSKKYPSISILLLQAEGHGKKSAVTQAVGEANGKLILVTDADCMVTPNWIQSFVSTYERKGARCISGPVKMVGGGIFGSIQALEFMSLVGSGAGSIGAGMPVMCNGANFCYEKSAFTAVNGFKGNHRYASGDDIFLMLKINRVFSRGAVAFLRDPKAIVTTPAQPNFKAFFRQRMRWSSKSPGYTDFGIILTALAVFLMNAGMLATLALGLAIAFWEPFLLLSISKLIIDLPLLAATATFMNQRRLLFYYLPVQLLMPFYVVLTAVGGVLINVSWKGRPVR